MNAIAPNLSLVVVAGFLIATGVYLLLERALTRLILGIVLASNGVATLYLVVSGPAKGAPFVGARPADEMSDALPQAMVLTAIVIALASVGFVLSLAYRQWRITGSDDVPDDAEDELIKRLAERDEVSSTYDDDTQSTTEAQEEDATA
ncbi:Na(+)/H(+) antiporter subunit C [Janibacter indicus]|uniref:Multisubunit sodium/proton antiporter, MrpC subunit n=1 Tax=Janibacter indicus TaxID=857417 RepID=A0A1W2BFP9_9MICO|nr:Na(+)/H(+) antiporter subunit C [Janibacter indicus]QOK23243.1 Na(+)/H(+) antiporter subunit C [Janibacter indicus]SMC71843.1 multisubunit sodium/proton antiporter, MrpC subunit [Janibacter indicus]